MSIVVKDWHFANGQTPVGQGKRMSTADRIRIPQPLAAVGHQRAGSSVPGAAFRRPPAA